MQHPQLQQLQGSQQQQQQQQQHINQSQLHDAVNGYNLQQDLQNAGDVNYSSAPSGTATTAENFKVCKRTQSLLARNTSQCLNMFI